MPLLMGLGRDKANPEQIASRENAANISFYPAPDLY